jgi:lysozyme
VAPAPTPAPSPAPAQQSAAVRKPASQWSTNEAALQLIRDSEGLRLSAYSGGKQWLIGYGHSDGVTQGMTITKDQADTFLKQDVRGCEHTVRKSVNVDVSENEFGAMVSLCFSIGDGNFSKSAVVTKLNAGDRSGAADGFLAWVHAGGKVLPRLTDRRKAERALFLS